MKILVTGTEGLMGRALENICDQYPDDEFIFCSRKDADLTKEDEVASMYDKFRPEYVIHPAAKVGGIGLNLAKPGELFYQNILMNSFMIHYAHLHDVKKIICYTSVCSFSDKVDLLKEELQQAGEPFEDNFAYGYAKRMADIQIKAYRKQYGVNYCSIISTNLYGINDNFNLEDGHVIPALIHKCYLAKKNNTPLTLWGDGSSLREFVYADDMAHLTMSILKDSTWDKIIVSNTLEMSIKEVCQIICEHMDFKGKVIFDMSKPNGQYRRPSDTSRLQSMVPNFQFTDHKDGIGKTIKWFCEKYPEVRKGSRSG